MPLPAHLDRTPHMRAIAAGALLATALLTSIAIMLTVTLGAAPKVAAQEPVTDEIQTLVSNVDASEVDHDTINVNLNGTAQVFRTGPQLGIRLDSIDVKFGTSVDKKYIVLNAGLHAVNDDGSRGARLTGFSYGDKKNNQMNRFWARDQVELEPSTAYMFVITCTAGCANNNYLNIRRVSDNAEDEGSAEGWSIDDGRILPSDNWTPKPRIHSLKMSVQGTSGHSRVVEDGFQIISSPVIGDVYGNRELIRIGVTFTDPVTVNDDAGTPTLKFSLGDPDNPARTERMRYASGSGADTLVFEYRVLPADQDANGIYIHSNSLQLNGGTINRAGYDLAALLRHPIPTGYGRARIDSSIERPLAKLTGLNLTDPDITDIVLRPDFSPDLINYAATVHGGVAATTVTATRDDDTNVTITPADSNDFQPGHQVALEEGDNVIEILVTKPGHIDVPYTVEIRREPLVIPRITRVRVISSPLNQNTNVYRNDEPVEFEFTFDHPVVVDLSLARPTLAVDIWLNDSRQSPTDFPYARGSGTNALVFQLLNDEAGLLETAVGFGLSANSINVPEHSSITHSPGGGNANLNHRALHRISNQYLDDRRNAPLAALDQVRLTNVTLDQRFRSRKTLYTATPDHGTTVTTVTVTPKDGVSYTIMPEDADDVADGHQVTLHHGTNEIVLTATKEGAATMTYTIAVVVLTTPRVESIAIVSEAPDNHTYVVGDVIKIAVTFDQPILVDTTNGTPIIRVRFGSDEQPVDYSETTDDSRTIIFSHTVDHSRRDGDGISIPENPMNANGGIIRYLHSNTRAFLDHQGIPDQTQHRVDPDPAIIDDGVQITSNPIDGDTYDSGETITFTVQFNTQITVKTDEGTPYLQFTMGDDAKQAGYTAISGDKRTLTFSYTVAAGDRDDDGISMAANALIRNGGTIKDENSINDALLEHPAPGTNGVFIGHNVDGNRPTIADGGVAVISTPLALPDAYGRNEIIVVSVTFTSPVVVDTTDGTPTLSIKMATPTYFPLHRKAQYQRGSGSSTLQFEWRVRRIDWDTNGIGILADALQLNGGTIRDAVTGTDVLLTNPWIDPVINFPDHKVRGGLLADFASLSDLSLSGGTLRPAFDSTVLRYTAAFPTDTTSTTVTATAPSGNTVAIQPDDADSETTGHQVDLTQEPEEIIVTVTTASAATYIYRVKTFLSDTEITSLAISSDPGSDSTYATGDVITATVTYNVPVTVDTTDGTPALKLKVGDTARAASYTGTDVSGKVLTFSYTVVSEDSDQDGVSIAANSLTLNSGSITADEDDADALLIHVALPTRAGHLVNKIPLIVTDGVQITSNPASGDTYQAGETITFTVTLDSDVEVDTTDGTPSLAITLGNANRQAAYTGIDATKRILTFAYTVASDDLDEDGLSVSANAIALNNGTITHTTTGKDADLSHEPPGTGGSFPYHRADGSPVAPAIAADGVTVTSTPYADGDTYGRDDIIVIGVTFTTPVAVDTTDGTPTLSVRIGDAGLQSRNRKAEYKRGTGSATLQFEWRVRANDRDNNGIQILADSLELNGGTIQHATNGTDAQLTHPLPGGNGIFADHKVDGRLLPALASLSTLSFSGATLSPTFQPTTIGYTATFPADAASTTVTATAESGTTITIEPADSDTETDGHQVDLTEAPDEITVTVSRTDSTDRVYRVNIALVSAIITDLATITDLAIISDPGSDGTYATGDAITVAVTYDQAVEVDATDGTPNLAVTIGDNARAASYTGHNEAKTVIAFSYTVVSEDSDQDGISIAANSLTLNNGAITADDDDADASLAHAALETQTGHLVNKTPLIVANGVQITSTPASGDTYQAGETVTFTVTFDSDVAVDTTDGTPSLAVTLGSANRQAAYTGIDATQRILTFSYTVASGDLDEDGLSVPVNAIDLNSGTITHTTTSKDADLSHGLPGTSGSFPNHRADGDPDVPAITSVTLSSDAGTDNTYATGDAVTVAVTYSEAVAVDTTSGTPGLTLTVGSNARSAGYTTIDSAATTLTFSYTVVSDDSDQDGISIAADSLALNSGTIRNKADTIDASLSHAALPAQAVNLVNKIPLIIANGVDITSAPSNGDTYRPDETISFGVTFDSDVAIDTTDGTPTLALTVGTTAKSAAYAAIDVTNRILTFSYTVADDDLDDDGLSVPANAIALNNGTIKHTTTGKDADLSHPLPGTNGVFTGHSVNASSATNGTDAPAATVLVANFNSPRESSLKIDSSNSGIGQVFRTGSGRGYRLESVTAITRNGRSADTITLEASVHHLTNNQRGAKLTTLTHTSPVADLTMPVFTDPNNIELEPSTAYMFVIRCTSGCVNNAHARFSMARDDQEDPGTVAGWTIENWHTRASSNWVNIGFGQPQELHISVQGTANHPYIINNGLQIVSTPATDGPYGNGETIRASLTFNHSVTVDATDGNPRIAFTMGDTVNPDQTAYVDYTDGSGTATLYFEYTVQPGDHDTDGIEIDSSALELNGGAITDAESELTAILRLPAQTTLASTTIDGGTIPDPGQPAVTAVALTSNPGTDQTYATGDTITATVTYDEAVTVDTTDGTPGLTLTIGDNARNAGYTSIDSSETVLTFSYTVVADDSDQDGISIAADSLALNSGTIRNKADTADASLGHTILLAQADHLVNKIPLIVAGGVQITSNPASGDTYLFGETITFTATFDAPVTVTTTGGFPFLAFTLGDTAKSAAYNSTSANGKTLGFAYTVVAGDLDTDGVSVAANALSLNGGTIKHSTTDKDADLSHPLPGTSGLFAGHKVDAIPDAPTITSVTLTSNAGTDNTYATFDAITAAVTYSEAIVVDTTDGTPSLALTIGDTARSAGYTSIDSSETVLTFSYTVISDDSDQDGIAIAANSLALNAGTIRNKADTVDASLTHAALATQTGHLVNKIPLIITDGVDITSSPASGNPYAPGEAITFGVTFDSDVIVDTTNGTPTLALTVGSTAKQATYTTIDATNRILTFSYAVVSGDLDEDGVSVAANALALNNGAIKHFTTGRDADLSHPLPGTNGVFPQHQVGRRDITALSISSDPGIHATYATGDTITVAVTFAEQVTVDTTGGTPYLPLTIGSMTRNAAYTSTDSSGLVLTFSYTIVAEDRDNNGPSIAANSLTLDGGTIRHAGTTNDVSLTHPALPNQTGHRINRAPAIVNNGVDVTSSPLGDETYGLNETITISVTFNSVVVVDTTNGTPRVDVLFAAYHNDDDDRARFRYARGSGTKTLEFDYTVQSGDRDSNGIFISLNQLFLDGGTITHITTGRNANLRHGPAGDSGTLAEHKVDGSTINIPRPRISSIEFGTDPSRLQTYITGSTINVIVTFDEEVDIDETNGTPTIALTIGDAVRNAAYVGSISGTIDMHYYYTVVAEDSDQDGVSIAANAISLNGATIRNSDDTVDASLTHAAVPDNPDHVVNKIPLIVTGGVQIASTPSSDDTYGRNEIITFIVAFDSDVTVDVIDGTPYLEFTIGDNLRTAAYDASSSSDRSLVFSYTVVQADSDDDGVSMAANAVNLDGASITHSQIGTDADLTHPAPGIFAGHEVDGSTIAAIRPVITGLAISSDPGADRTYAAGDVITATVTFDQPVTVTLETASGELWLPLTIGESQREAHYSSTDSSGHVLTFAYTVVEQDSDPDGVSIPRNSISSQSVRVDLSGQTLHANLFHLELDDQPDHRVNAAPRIINRGVRIESSPRNGDTYRIGETISFSVTFDAPVVVDTTKGTPHMRLRVDDSPGADNAPYLRYSGGSGSRTLYFSWTIPQRTRDHSGIYMGANQLHAGRGSIRHASTGRDAILEHQRPGRLDGEFPDHKILPRHYRYITNLALASDAGDDRTYRTGDVITATVRFNDDIDLNTAGGSPFFRLIIGETLRLAQYSAQDSTSDTLHFHYTVVAEDRDDDGVYMRSNGLQLNGSVITAAGETDEAFVKHPWVEDQHRHRVNTP